MGEPAWPCGCAHEPAARTRAGVPQAQAEDPTQHAVQQADEAAGGVGALDLAWFHGFDYKIEEGEHVKREARSGWIRTWYESDL